MVTGLEPIVSVPVAEIPPQVTVIVKEPGGVVPKVVMVNVVFGAPLLLTVVGLKASVAPAGSPETVGVWLPPPVPVVLTEKVMLELAVP